MMKIQQKFCFILILTFFLFITGNTFAQHTARASIDNNEYKPGDIITVRIDVTENSGFFGLYFDLLYNDQALALKDITQSAFTKGYPSNGKIKYALADKAASAYDHDFVVATFALDEKGQTTESLGTVMELFFTVKTGSIGINRFEFSNCGFISPEGDIVPGTWIDSEEFVLEQASSSEYIRIIDPYNYQVLEKGDEFIIDEDDPFDYLANTSITCSQGNYTVRIYNQALPGTGEINQLVTQGFLLDKTIPLLFEYNNITAELRNSLNELVATDSIIAYLSPDDKFVKIISPADHSLHITDMVEVTIRSTMDHVEVNDMDAEYSGDGIFKINLWLKQGFNSIKAIAWDSAAVERLVYKDEISVYYQKNDSLFQFISPRNGQSFKPGDNSGFVIRGEIGSKYKSAGDYAGNSAVENKVTVDIYYEPANFLINPYYLAENLKAAISEIDIPDSGIERQSRYIFQTETIPLAGLKNGKLTITAYKNKDENGSEAEISRIVYIDNNRLSINLIQPMVFSKDVLDSKYKVNSFNLDPVSFDQIPFANSFINLDFDGNGSIQLTSSGILLESQGYPDPDNTSTDIALQSIVDVEEAPDGTLYLLQNAETTFHNGMVLYKKGPDDEDWRQIYKWWDAVGYDLCYTRMGILIGATHLYSNDDPCMYILEDDTIYSMELPVDLLYTQFIECINNKVYFYGNDYIYLYSFDENTIRRSLTDPDAARMVAEKDLIRIPFTNNVSIKQFILTGDGQTAVLRTRSGEVQFYNKSDIGYVLEEEVVISGTHIAGGSYSGSDFAAFVILNDADPEVVEVVMKSNKTNKYTRLSLDISEAEYFDDDIDYMWCGFTGDYFTFMYRSGSSGDYFIQKGQLFFDRFNLGTEKSVGLITGTIDEYNHLIFTTMEGNAFINYGLTDTGLNLTKTFWGLNYQYEATGNADFNYINRDIKGISGFAFDIHPLWITENSPVEIGFTVHSFTGKTDLPEGGKTTLDDFLTYEDELFKVSHYFDSAIQQERVYVDFTPLREDIYISFSISIHPAGNVSPGIHDFSVFKKIPVFIARNGDAELFLPIRGNVNDRTVKEIYIQGTAINLERDGSFYRKIPIISEDLDEDNSVPVILECSNSANEKAIIEFKVKVVDSFCHINELTLESYTPDQVIPVTSENMNLEGRYFGLNGVNAGYELRRLAFEEEEERILERGVFQTRTYDNSLLDDFISEYSYTITEKQDYSAFTFGQTDTETITLYPGQQKLILYVENPNGFRKEIVRIINYNIPDSEQEIVINPSLETTIADSTEENTIILYAYEKETPGGFIFNRYYELSGYVKTNYITDVIKARSMTQGLLFPGEKDVADFALELENRFIIPLHITMDETINKTFQMELTTGIPGVNELRKVVNIKVKNNYANTRYIPDLTPMIPPSLDLIGDTVDTIVIAFRMNRKDIPVPTIVSLTCNFTNAVSGKLIKQDPDDDSVFPIYVLEGVDGLPGLKPGNNRISWKCEFIDPTDAGGNTKVLMSSSRQGIPGMADTLFVYNPDEKLDTVIRFSEDLSTNCYGNDGNGNTYPLPSLVVTKDESTNMTITLNGSAVDGPWVTSATAQNLSYNLESSPFRRQGKNEILITYQEYPYKEDPVTEQYAFLYDSEAPVVTVEEKRLEVEETATTVTVEEFSVFVKEANYDKVFLYQGQDIIDRVPDNIKILDYENLRLTWKNIILNPGTHVPYTLAATVEDITGKKTTSEAVSNIENNNEPDNWETLKYDLSLDLFDGDPAGIDDDYRENIFSAHSKFAPYYLYDQSGRKSTLAANGYNLIRNIDRQQIMQANPYDYDIKFGQSIATSGNYLAVGAPFYGKTVNTEGEHLFDGYWGRVFIYQREIDGSWVYIQSLSSHDEGWFEYGTNVVMGGNHMIISAMSYYDEADDPNIYMNYEFYELNNGVWNYVTSFHDFYEEGDRPADYKKIEDTSMAMDSSGNYFITGTPHFDGGNGWVVISRWNGSSWDIIHEEEPDSGDNQIGYGTDISNTHAVTRNPGIDPTISLYKIDGSTVTLTDTRPIDGTNYGHYYDSISTYGNYVAYGKAKHHEEKDRWIGEVIICSIDTHSFVTFQTIEQPQINGDYIDDYFGKQVELDGDFLIASSRNNYFFIFKKSDESGLFEFQRVMKQPDPAPEQPDTLIYLHNSITANSNRPEVIVSVYDKLNAYDTNGYVYSYKMDNFIDSDLTYFEIGAEDTKRQLFFKIDKNQIDNKNEIRNKIVLEVKSQKYSENLIDIAEGDTEELDTSGYSTIIEADDYYYYVINAAPLRAAYKEAAESIINFDPFNIFPASVNQDDVFYDVTLNINSDINIADFLITSLISFEDFSKTIVYNENYEDPDRPGYPHPGLNTNTEATSGYDSPATENKTILMWLRSDEEGAGKNKSIYGVVEKAFFYYKDSEETKKLLELRYRENNDNPDILLYNDSNLIATADKKLQLGKDTWNLIALRFSPDFGIDMFINGVKTNSVSDLPVAALEELVQGSEHYYFGSEAYWNTGFYSIAEPCYVNAALKDDDIERIYTARLNEVTHLNAARNYDLNDATSDFGDSPDELRAKGGTDYFTSEQRAFYQPDGGSLKASSSQKNYMKTTGTYPMLLGAHFQDERNTSINVIGDIMEISPADPEFPATYFFGDQTGNYGLRKNRWYSVSGHVYGTDSTGESKIVLRINGEEQSMVLTTGDFHFIYNNENLFTPEDVVLFLETTETLFIDTDFIFNEGNYILETDIQETCAFTKYYWGYEGTVGFWYKPLNANNSGTVNYETVLFDSEYIKIGTKIPAGETEAYFYAQIKKGNSISEELVSTIKVLDTWQRIHFTFDWDTGRCFTYFYINDKLVDSIEQSSSWGIPDAGTITGRVTENDNVYIGSDLARTQFAEGYIDDITISNLFETPVYSPNHPVRIRFNPNTEEITLSYDPASADPVDSISYILETVSGFKIRSGEVFSPTQPVDVRTLSGGRYRLKTTFITYDHSYNDYLLFNIDKEPSFALVKQTPFIVRDLPFDIDLQFLFDPYQHFEKDDLVYPGIAVGLYDESSTTYPAISQYIVGNFLSQEPNIWLRGTQYGRAEIKWEAYSPDNSGYLHAFFKEYIVENEDNTNRLTLEYKPFYIDVVDLGGSNPFNFVDLGAGVDTIIPVAQLHAEKVKHGTTNTLQGYEYKLDITVEPEDPAAGTIDFSSLNDDLLVNYHATQIIVDDDETGTIESHGSVKLQNGQVSLFYDDMLPRFGTYNCVVSLQYKGRTLDSCIFQNQNTLKWTGNNEEIIINTESHETIQLEMVDLSLCYMDTEDNSAELRFTFDYYIPSSITPDILITAYILNNNNARKLNSSEYHPGFINVTNTLGTISNFITIDNIPKGDSTIRLTFTKEDVIRSMEIDIRNDEKIPEVIFTNRVDRHISHNNIYLSWRGEVENKFNDNIKFSYNFNGQGWTTPDEKVRDLRLFDLAQGDYTFAVKAYYNDCESPPYSLPFTVDTERPIFNITKIEKIFTYDPSGIPIMVKLIGDKAISDIDLRSLMVNNIPIEFTREGSFETGDILLTKDGDNEILLTAYDRVNFTDCTIVIKNPLTKILYPNLQNSVRYSPFVLVGQILDTVPSLMTIYVSDPMTKDKGPKDYSNWKKAVINEDRTFFVEDIFINPGTHDMELTTVLNMVCVLESGYTFERELRLDANEIIMPIELEFSTHAVEGQNADTEITIDCHANVPNISSWSCDFDGDGIYDVIDLIDNPASVYSKDHSWKHAYSTIGLIKPRVRVVTTDGVFFSVTDTLTIHEKIKDASPTLVNNPISLSAITSRFNTQRLFILRKEDQIHYLDIYTIPQFDPWPFKSEDSINLSVMNMENPVRVRAIDENRLIIADNRRDHAVIYQLTANEFGNYDNDMRIQMTVSGEVRDISIDSKTLYISFIEEAYIVKVPIRDNTIIPSEKEDIVPNVPNALPVGISPGIEADDLGLLIADYENSRVLRLSEKYRALEKYATIGTGEKEFIEPCHIISHQNRIFVFDNRRKDIQVFDSGFGLVTTLRYNLDPNYENYVSDTFFNDVADIEVIAREENKRIYYYAFILSRTDNKLAVLRLPQWEEFRVRVRNNKLVFIKNGEVYTSKPTGADLKKILSSDSIPRIEGSLDYPALSPDGTSLVFTSRDYLYHGDPDLPDEQPYGYDYLYLYDIESGTLRVLDLGYLAGHSIERPTFSSNGDRIIFSAKGRDENWQIYIYTIKSGDIQELDVTVGNTPENARFPYFSPDDRYVVFTTDYDGDEDIEIYDTKTTMRMVVTDNNARDSYPVWNAVYPDEIETSDWEIESKIAFVSDRDFHKAVYTIYLSRPNPDNLLIFNIYTGETGGNPDDAAIEMSKEYISDTEYEIIEGDYPCFTGDGTQLFLETSDGYEQQAKKFDFTNEQNHDNIKLENHDGFIFEDINILKNIRRMSGMKNTITNFTAENVDGNCIQLKWDRYTAHDIFYYVEFRHSSQGEPDYKKVSTQDNALLQGLRMNDEYTVRVFVKELGDIVTASQWRTVKMPVVAARPTITIDGENPYLVRLHAWKADEDDRWGFSWKIDNTLFPAGESQDYDYEFGTSGTKSISLIATNLAGEHDEISQPVMVEIKSDIRPVIEYVLADDSSAIELSAESSKGRKINWAETRWVITGSGNQQEIVRQGPVANVDLTNFSNKINVTLYISRIPVNDQQTTDVLIKTTTIDLDLKDVRPIITEEPDKDNPQLIYFSGENSIGNIDWTGAQWTVYKDGAVIDQRNSVSSFAREFSRTNIETIYSITLTVPCRNSHLTETTSKIISVSPAPIEPVIEHQILRLTEDGNTVTAKLLLDCTKSTGNNIDFTKAQWNIAGVGAYGEDPTQYGPTAIYTMSNIGSDAILPVVLTLSRRDGDNPVSVTKFISIASEDLGDAELFINKTIEEGTDGNILILDVLNSTGPNINWEATTWTITIPGQTQYEAQQIQEKGPVVQIDVEAAAENMEITYTCTLYRHGGKPETVTGSVDIRAQKIYPVISTYKISGSYDNYFELTVLESEGMNIDWDKTTWYIYDGHESVVTLKGATISHAFIQKEKAMGYPVLVEMFFNGSSIPFTGYETVGIEADEMNPIIRYDQAPDNPNTFIFNASGSRGNNLKWTNTTWTFGDSTQPSYGPVVSHTFPVSSQKTTYRISCTIMRTSSNGQEETKTIYKEIDIKEDGIRPAVTARVMDGTLVLSAEESKGRGLLLDRSVWLFPGEGDSTSYSGQTIEGTIERESSGSSKSFQGNYQFGTGGTAVSLTTLGGSFGSSEGVDTTGYSEDYKVNNDSFSSQNAHIGVICRRTIDDANQTTQMVTLMVYRITEEGTQAESITVNINLDKARSGVTYW